MTLLERIKAIFSATRQNDGVQVNTAISRDANSELFIEFKSCLYNLLKKDDYISKKEYMPLIEKNKELISSFNVLRSTGMIHSYAIKNGLDINDIDYVLDMVSNLELYINDHNENFISSKMESERLYLDTILSAVDDRIMLDDDQRRVVLTDEDYMLVIAGAGAGKTTTVAAKVKYLVEKKHIEPSQILVVSFTNKAVNELAEKINKQLDIPCPIATFHSTGNAIIHKNSPDEKLNIVDSSKLYFVLRDYFRNSILQNESVVNKLIMFFATYFDAPYEGDDLNMFFNKIAKSNFSTMRSDLEDFKREVIDRRTKKSVTIQNEVLRSFQEVEIANFLFLNNIDYEYEPIYPYDIPHSRKPYTPDFILKQGEKSIYLEHFGISEDGKNDRFSDEEIERYKNAVNDKVLLHREHGTKLIYTFSSYKDGKPLSYHLRERLENAGFEIRPRSNKEVMEMLVAGEENRYIKGMISLLCRFISNFKVNGYTEDDFNRFYHSTQNVRSRLFIDICNDCYLEYQRYLRENKAVDFQDMINESARILRETKEMNKKLDFKYVIVDEYQDISRQRFDLTKALSDVTDAKIIAVGDDWQSIYAFSGSDITLFTKFEQIMGYAKLLKIVKTYRNSQEVIDIAGNFIQENPEQISKSLISNKHIKDPVIIYTYDNYYKRYNADRRTGANYATALAVQTALDHIIEACKTEGRDTSNVLLLGRFGFDGYALERSGLFEFIDKGSYVKSIKYPKIKITFMTAHASKGLGYDDVIIINGKNETYGFPSKIQDDPVLKFVIKGDDSIDYAEERRLFYVSLTRTKNRVYVVAPESNPSEFLLEIKRKYKNVVLKGNWNEDEIKRIDIKKCPMCGYPMQFKYKNAYGLRLYICCNEPEICGFMTNEIKAGKLNICKCNQCRDGYMIVKPGIGKYKYFLGCTNYKKDGTGCKNTIDMLDYYKDNHLDISEYENTLSNVNDKNTKKETTTNRRSSTRNNNSDNSIHGTNSPDEAVIKKPDIEGVIYKDNNLNDIVFYILTCTVHMNVSKFYGIDVLIEILHGEKTDRIKKLQFSLLPEYGKLARLSKFEIKDIISWLTKEGFLLETRDAYPVLHSTYNGLHYGEIITKNKLQKLKKYLEN